MCFSSRVGWSYNSLWILLWAFLKVRLGSGLSQLTKEPDALEDSVVANMRTLKGPENPHVGAVPAASVVSPLQFQNPLCSHFC